MLLQILQDGRLLIPCNVDIVRLIDFLTKNASRSQFINSSARQLQVKIIYFNFEAFFTKLAWL